MFLRILLIGVAVATGSELDPPASDDFASWARTAQVWCNARLESLMTQTRISESDWTSECEAVATADVPPTTTPISMNDVCVPAEQPEAAVVEPAVESEVAAIEPAAECVAAAELMTADMNPDAAFEMAMSQTIDAFIADLPAAPVGPEATAVAAVADETLPLPPSAVEVAPLVETETPFDLVAYFADEMQACDPFAAGQLTDAFPPTPATTAETAVVEEPTTTVVATLELPAECFVAETEATPAPALAVEPTSEAPAVANEPESSPIVDRAVQIGSAVRLTGEALRAWVQVLQPSGIAMNDQAAILSR